MKCPRQEVFARQLKEIIDLSRDLGRDHFSVDEWEAKADKLSELKKNFINNWCPILKDYEPRESTDKD